MITVGAKATILVNGQPLEVESLSISTRAPKRELPRSYSGTFELRVDAVEWADFHRALLAVWDRPMYWWRRRAFAVRQYRKQLARVLGVPYRDMLHFCRTGLWP